MADPADITLDLMRESLYSAAVADSLDALGCRRQSPRVPLPPLTGCDKLIGRCKTTLWAEFAYDDPHSYDGELKTVDSCSPDDVVICAAGGSTRAAVWGEILSTAARNGGCVGAIADGSVRDLAQMTAMQFSVFARGACVYDGMNRIKIVDLDVPVEIDGVTFRPGELVIADRDGVVVVPREVECEAIDRAWHKVHDENRVRDAIDKGMKAVDAWKKYGVL